MSEGSQIQGQGGAETSFCYVPIRSFPVPIRSVTLFANLMFVAMGSGPVDLAMPPGVSRWPGMGKGSARQPSVTFLHIPVPFLYVPAQPSTISPNNLTSFIRSYTFLHNPPRFLKNVNIFYTFLYVPAQPSHIFSKIFTYLLRSYTFQTYSTANL